MINQHEQRHPVHYGIFKPNPLVLADRSQLKGIEISVYNEILNHNHKQTPEILVYEIPYKVLWPEGNTNLARDKQRIREALQSKSIMLGKEFMQTYFNEQDEVSINPFPKVRYKKDSFEVTLYQDFKTILTMIDLGFTKGDIETLRTLKHDISQIFYWLARHQQSFKRTWTISVEEFREKLYIQGYKDWRNFKRRILDAIQEDMKDTWIEFDLEFVKKGQGGSIKDLIFKFKNGPEEEKDKPVGFEFRWEKDLKSLGIDERMIKQFRQYVKAKSETKTENGQLIIWDSTYIFESIKAAAHEFKQKEADPKRKKIANKAAWFVSGLMTGQWITEVMKERQAIVNATQQDLFPVSN